MEPGVLGFKKIDILKSHTLGIGSYGAVYKAKCDHLLCAAKILHPTLLDRDAELLVAPDKVHRLPIRRFVRECEFLSVMRHPNIIQYLGRWHDPVTNLPVLLMELMDESLTQFLGKSNSPIPFHTQVNICHDISLALSFLHSNDIIHRDLSSNNVLMLGDRRAKVTDFGMAKIFHMRARSMTKVPGTEVYMPPEALQDDPIYSSKLDCFTFGVLVIQILTKLFPKPDDKMRKMVRNGEEFYQRMPESERRGKHIGLITPDHPLLPLALVCINDDECSRPSADAICERVGAIKRLSSQNRASGNTCMQENGGLDEIGVASLSKYISTLESVLQQKDQHIREISAEFQGRNDLLERRLRGLVEDVAATTGKSDIAVTFREGKRAPRALYRMSNAVVHGESVYFVSTESQLLFYRYNSLTSEWSQLPDIDTDREWHISTIAVVLECLTTVGGYDEDENLTNQLFSLIKGEGVSKWEEVLPPMPTKRDGSIAFSCGRCLVVAGGSSEEEESFLRTVEVLDTESMQWFVSVPLPEPLSMASTTLCGDTVFVLGGWFSSNTPTCSVLSCNIENLLHACRPCPANNNNTDNDKGGPHYCGVWNRVADLPVLKSTCVTYQGHLLAVGGVDVMNRAINAVYKYDGAFNSWRVVGRTSISRGQAFATLLSTDELLVVGGHKGYYLNKIYEVEIGTIHSD